MLDEIVANCGRGYQCAWDRKGRIDFVFGDVLMKQAWSPAYGTQPVAAAATVIPCSVPAAGGHLKWLIFNRVGYIQQYSIHLTKLGWNIWFNFCVWLPSLGWQHLRRCSQQAGWGPLTFYGNIKCYPGSSFTTLSLCVLSYWPSREFELIINDSNFAHFLHNKKELWRSAMSKAPHVCDSSTTKMASSFHLLLL